MGTYGDEGVVFHKALLGARKQAQEGQNERRCTQRHRYEGEEPHLAWKFEECRQMEMDVRRSFESATQSDLEPDDVDAC